MRILFINPNRYHHPPVIPVGIEYLIGEIEKSEHEARALDLCFEADPLHTIKNAINSFDPHVVGFSIRQIDTVLYQNNQFFLDEIKLYVDLCRLENKTIILGGAGFSIMPEEILLFMEANYGIIGPGERAVIYLLDHLSSGNHHNTIIDGYTYFPDISYTFNRKASFDYRPYLKNEGIVGFRTQIGCKGNCIFCTEANKPLIFHNPDSVGKEIKMITNMGFHRFHLCDSEFNQDINHCISVCKSIINHAGKINWALYMKPEPINEELFYWLKESGASLITLSVNSNEFRIEILDVFIEFTKQYNIPLAIDLSAGLPYEQINSLQRLLQFLNKKDISTIGVNSFFRIYPYTTLYEKIRNDVSLQKNLIRLSPETNYLCPVFYNHLGIEELNSIIPKANNFRIEGFDAKTNYQRIKK